MIDGAFARFRARLASPADPAGLALFRVGFGLLMAASLVRFVLKGWVDELYFSPRIHFPYWGFSWIAPWSREGLYVHVGMLLVAALAIAVGFFPRVFAAIFLVGFTYLELLDKTLYLNHYYLVSLLAFLLVLVPSDRVYSLGARRDSENAAWVSTAHYGIFRAQLTLVYFFAGVAKLNADWLFRAEPVHGWLLGKSYLPIVGPLFAEKWVAYGMSWFGAAFDITIPFFLTWRRTRGVAFVVAMAFHIAIWLLFPVGVFSWVMLLSISVFFEPSWPRRFFGGTFETARRRTVRESRLWFFFVALHLLVQVLVPLRFLLYPGPVNWTEEGFRFSFRVMLIEKQGRVEYIVESDDGGRTVVFPRRDLTPLQLKMLSTQPDMILDYAHLLRTEFERKGRKNVVVRADSWISFNGRPSQRYIDPKIDLSREPRSLAPYRFVLPLEE